jgi:hypothetical protein
MVHRGVGKHPRTGIGSRTAIAASLIALALIWGVQPIRGQVPEDRVHLSLSLGGYVMVGLGYTHWIKDHHAVEVTVYPFAYPGEGFPVGVKAGYAWIPSIEVWRAKLGGNVTVLVHKPDGDRGRFTPLVAFTPGLQYDPTASRSVRMDLWMSYFLTEKVFAPTNLEVLYAWKK